MLTNMGSLKENSSKDKYSFLKELLFNPYYSAP